MDILDDCEKRALVSLDGAVDFTLKDKVRNGKLYVDQGIIAGCAGGGFENICDAADILKGASIGPDEFTLSVYPASTPIYMELVKTEPLQIYLRQVRSLRQHSADHASEQVIPQATTDFPFVIPPETSRTAKVLSYRMARSHP